MKQYWKRSRAVRAFLSHLPLLVGAVIFLFPFVWLILSSLKTTEEAVMVPQPWIPSVLKQWPIDWGKVI
ncbi:MAG: hypothetical protein ABIH23_29405, partial [bacterium]